MNTPPHSVITSKRRDLTTWPLPHDHHTDSALFAEPEFVQKSTYQLLFLPIQYSLPSHVIPNYFSGFSESRSMFVLQISSLCLLGLVWQLSRLYVWEDTMATRRDYFRSAFFLCFLLQGCFPVKRNGFVGCGNPVGVWKCHSSSCMVNVNDIWADFDNCDSAKSQPNVSCTEIYNADMDLTTGRSRYFPSFLKWLRRLPGVNLMISWLSKTNSLNIRAGTERTILPKLWAFWLLIISSGL